MDNLKKIGVTVSAVYAAAYALRSGTIRLRHFKPADFGIWWPFMNGDFLSKVDQFSEWFQGRVMLSPAPGALGRLGSDSSQHFPSPDLSAADLMLPDISLGDAYQAARALGFTGIGLYPDWKPYHGIHLDMRKTRTRDNPALWAGVKTGEGQKYVAIEQVLNV
jgi:hypothetical protein